MASPTAARALRVGVLLGGNLVEERLFRNLTPVTIGQSLRCTLSIPADGVPREHLLFVVDQGQLMLRLTAKMTGRLAQGDTIRTELCEGTGVSGVWTIPLHHGARGKIQIGDATLLFQELAAPPLAPRPQLPASVRGTLLDRIDRRLAVIIAGSLVAHLGIATWAWVTEPERDPAAVEALAQFEPTMYDTFELTAQVEPVALPGPPSTEPGVAAPVAPKQTPSPIVNQPWVDRLPEPVDTDRWAQIMTGNTTGPNGQNEIKHRLPGATLDKQIANIRDNNMNVVGSSDRIRPDPTLRIGDGPNGPVIHNPTSIDQLVKTDEKPGRVILKPLPQPQPPDRPTLTVKMVLDRIQGSYMTGLQRCYVKHGLSHDLSMVAKVTAQFTVDEKGVSTENVASGASSDVDACIQGQMNSWRFPAPKDKDGDPTEVPFKVQLVLQPS